jgi:hypothetical protein
MKDVQVKKKKQLDNESTLPFIFAETKRVWKPVVGRRMCHIWQREGKEMT